MSYRSFFCLFFFDSVSTTISGANPITILIYLLHLPTNVFNMFISWFWFVVFLSFASVKQQQIESQNLFYFQLKVFFMIFFFIFILLLSNERKRRMILRVISLVISIVKKCLDLDKCVGYLYIFMMIIDKDILGTICLSN